MKNKSLTELIVGLEERVSAIEDVVYRPRRRLDEVENFDGVAKALEDTVVRQEKLAKQEEKND